MWGQDGWILAKLFFSKKERGQYQTIFTEQAWLITDLLYGFRGAFSCGTRRVVPSGQDVIYQKRVRLFHKGFQTPRNRWKHEATIFNGWPFSSPVLLVLKCRWRVALDAPKNSNSFIGWQKMNAQQKCKLQSFTHSILLRSVDTSLRTLRSFCCYRYI